MVEVRTSDVVPNQQGQKTALLDLSPYRMKHAVDVQTQGTAKALFAAQLETLIADAEPSTYEELETASTLEPVPAPMLSVRNAELEVTNAGTNLCVLAKALALNSQTPAQKVQIYKSCLALLDEHGTDVLDEACQQALVSGTSSLSVVVSIIRKQHDDATEIQPNAPTTITHSKIRGARYFN